MKFYTLAFSLLLTNIFAQNYDPETGEIIEKDQDRPADEKSIGSLPLSLNEFDFDEIYNEETIYPSPPFFGNNVTSKYYKATKGPYTISKKEIEKELLKYQESDSLFREHKKWALISYFSFVPVVLTPGIMLSMNLPGTTFVLAYGGIISTLYSINKYTKLWHKAIWAYNRENIKAQLYIDKE